MRLVKLLDAFGWIFIRDWSKARKTVVKDEHGMDWVFHVEQLPLHVLGVCSVPPRGTTLLLSDRIESGWRIQDPADAVEDFDSGNLCDECREAIRAPGLPMFRLLLELYQEARRAQRNLPLEPLDKELKRFLKASRVRQLENKEDYLERETWGRHDDEGRRIPRRGGGNVR